MLELIRKREDLDEAAACASKGHTYQALDIINKHIKEVTEKTKPNVEQALQTLTEYLDKLQEIVILLEQSTKASTETEQKLCRDAEQKITEATEKLGIIEECCKIMRESKKKLE